MNDARSYVIPIANIIGRRIDRICVLNNKLTSLISKLYLIPDGEDKTELCNTISKTISEIELLVLKNIDDSQILEYSLAEFTLKLPIATDIPTNPDARDQHFYFA
jgi:hypothetical protein